MTIRLSKHQRIRINSSKALYAVMQQVFLREQRIDRDREHFWIMGLATDNTLLFVELIALGSIRRVPVEPMDVFSLALQKRAVRIVLVHNHPSGSLVPSAEDQDLTDYLLQVGAFVNVPVLDHLIISEAGYYSFVDSGLLDQLHLSRKHVLPYQLQARLLADIKASEARGKAEGLKAGEARGLKAGKAEGIKAGEARGLKVGEVKGREAERLQVALALKAKGIEVGVIAEVTGLSVAKVKGLKAPKAMLSVGGKADRARSKR